MVAWRVCPGEEPIAAYAAGLLGRGERDAIDAHLDTCSACSELVAALAKLGSHAPASTDGDPETDRLLEGQLGRYILLSRLGIGGMGVVYAAYDPELDRRVALKLLHRGGADLVREARAIAKLAHPNVVAVHDIGRVDATPFVAMEYVDGVTLRDWLTSPRKPSQILDAFIQVGRGLAAAHAAGLVHRDVKPSNVMIGGDGRARVLDFGLVGADGIAGTPAYMAPEQARGEAVDARADQYAFCVALWEALAGERPRDAAAPVKGSLVYVADPIVRALRRGLAADPTERFPTMDALVAELAPRSRRHLPWLLAAVAVLAGTIGAAVAVTPRAVAPCALAGAPVDAVWSASDRSAVTASFTATHLPFAAASATTAIARLDDWAARWRAGAETSCRATTVELVQPAALHALRQACLDQLLVQLRPIVALASHADADIVDRANALVTMLPAPERCSDVVQLGALTPPSERVRDEVAAIETRAADLETALIAGRAEQVAPAIADLRTRADATGYIPVAARTRFLSARLAIARTQFSAAVDDLHAAAQQATAARDLELLAEIWIELVAVLGNDVRSGDEAHRFDGYVAALVPQLADRDTLGLRLEHARCNRNVTGAEIPAAIQHCTATIRLAEARPELANAARTRLGHFQRIAGHTDEALVTLHAAVAEATRIFGAAHPETATARYALGVALVAAGQVEAGIAELRAVLELRRAAFPNGGAAIAEALEGLGDALGEAGHHAEAVPYLEQGLTELDRAHASDSAIAVNLHMLAAMSLEELHHNPEALAHDLRAADLAERSLEHREELAAMALRLAAHLEPNPATGLAEVERALRLLERARAAPVALGKTQLDIAELAAATGDRTRARAMAETALASLRAAGPAGAEDIPEAQALLKR